MDLDGVRRHEPVAADDADRQAAVVAPVIGSERDPGSDPDPTLDLDHPGRDDPHLLFVKRADHLGQHPGQMAFPGGGREPSDADLLATALREADEEVGLQPAEADVVGRLDDIRTVTDYSVRPFVARVPDREYTPDEREVAEIAVLPVAALTDLANYESERRDHPHYGEIRLHFFRVDGYTVWGATARMLVQLLELTTEWRAPPEVDRVVDPDADLPL